MSWNQQLVKISNKARILQTIKGEAPISRADLSIQLGLAKGTVSSLVNELIDEKMCYEMGPGKSSGGRRPVMLLFNERAGYSIGIDLGVNYILGVLCDLSGNIVIETMKPMNNMEYGETLKTIKEVIKTLAASSPESHYGVVGIGIGVPGIVSGDGQNILLAPNLGWKNVNLKQDIADEFNLPVIIENEANAGACGEKHFGAGKEYDHVIYVSAGIGLGVGFILEGSLYRGANGFSGEMGHMIIDINGNKCNCGSVGCWELYASEQALLNGAKELSLFDQEEPLSLETLCKLASDHEEIRDLFKNIGKYLGIGINNIINIFNPQQIIIGNRLSIAEEWLLPSIREVVESHTLKQSAPNLQINFADLKSYSTAVGISTFVTEDFLKSDVGENLASRLKG
ncbi:ROK family protein [Neobacillus niacini]|uniref:ROK family protein n=1 Tax=Neobacillus niacini TaxID=86668 RepID=UPI0039832235